jgi:hypothetical protein
MMKKTAIAQAMDPVPQRYLGIWQRTLKQDSDGSDTTTMVRWLQTHHWHADIRIPQGRPDFSQVRSLDDCNTAQLAWLAQQQGFAGITEIIETEQSEICNWHRMVDYRPPRSRPDSGYMAFDGDLVVETGVHAEYLENWIRVPDSDAGFAVLQRLHGDGKPAFPRQFLMIAGDYVMHVRERAVDWPEGTPFGEMGDVDDAEKRFLLDFELSLGRRNASGWRVEHSTLPWLENKQMTIRLSPVVDNRIEMTCNGSVTQWQVHEWQPPAAHKKSV